MANPVPIHENPIVVAVIDNLQGRLDDVGAVQRLLDLLRPEIAANASLYAEAAQLAQARRSLVEALVDAAARGALQESEEAEELDPDDPAELAALAEAIFDADARRAPPKSEEEEQKEPEPEPEPELVDPVLEARAAAYAELADCVGHIQRLDRILAQALAFLIVDRAAAFAWTRAPLLPGVFLTAVLVLCFLVGFWD